MKVLVACEYSGIVRDAFVRHGYDAWSCDLKPSETPGNHYCGDILDILWYDWWDLLIAHPPCTHLASSGARWWPNKVNEQREAINFVAKLMNAWWIPHICIENPVGKLSTAIRKPDQIVQPWYFGDSFSKTTCLWLKNLPKLEPTNIVDPGEFVIHGGKKIPKWYSNRERNRDKTFPGMAEAMAQQWGTYIDQQRVLPTMERDKEDME